MHISLWTCNVAEQHIKLYKDAKQDTPGEVKLEWLAEWWSACNEDEGYWLLRVDRFWVLVFFTQIIVASTTIY